MFVDLFTMFSLLTNAIPVDRFLEQLFTETNNNDGF